MGEHVFDEGYAGAYDALYQDKDYEAECDFLEQVFASYAQSPVRTVLDLGCGTGGHAVPLAERGYIVTGVDHSEAMLLEASRKVNIQGNSSCRFIQGDIRDIDLVDGFDAIIAMFAVIGYQVTNKDLMNAFDTAWQHLDPGGLFVFDCWFGPAVLTQKPTDQYKVVKRGSESIIRYTSPVLDIFQHTVQVNYRVLRLKDSCVLENTEESHLMRFLFPQEIRHYLSESGFNLLKICPFMELGREATEHDWNITVVCVAM